MKHMPLFLGALVRLMTSCWVRMVSDSLNKFEAFDVEMNGSNDNHNSDQMGQDAHPSYLIGNPHAVILNTNPSHIKDGISDNHDYQENGCQIQSFVGVLN